MHHQGQLWRLQRGWCHLLDYGYGKRARPGAACRGDLRWRSRVFLDAQPRFTSSVNPQAFVGILSALLLGSAVVWFRLWLTQVAIDTKVRARVCAVCPVFVFMLAEPRVTKTASFRSRKPSATRTQSTKPSAHGCLLPPSSASSPAHVLAPYLRARVS